MSDLSQTATVIRLALQRLDSDEDRREALVLVGICQGCGKDHSEFLERRLFWTCDCEDGAEHHRTDWPLTT